MALSAQAALLDELMGKNRNAAPGDRVKNYHYSDRDVCKHFLCGFCPHELFVNTRADLGPCEKVHDENLKRQYQKSSRKGRIGYEDEFEVVLRSLLSEVEKRIKKGRDRLSLTQGSDDKFSSVRQDRIQALNEQINSLISEADQLGREGNVDAAKEALDKCERLKIERLDLETRHTSENAKAMEVCNVCGSFLIVGDAQCRVEEHITGKQHVGFAKIRSTLEQLRTDREKATEERRLTREKDKSKTADNKKSTPDHSRLASSSVRHRSRSLRRQQSSHRTSGCGVVATHRSPPTQHAVASVAATRTSTPALSAPQSQQQSLFHQHKQYHHNQQQYSKSNLPHYSSSSTGNYVSHKSAHRSSPTTGSSSSGARDNNVGLDRKTKNTDKTATGNVECFSLSNNPSATISAVKHRTSSSAKDESSLAAGTSRSRRHDNRRSPPPSRRSRSPSNSSKYQHYQPQHHRYQQQEKKEPKSLRSDEQRQPPPSPPLPQHHQHQKNVRSSSTNKNFSRDSDHHHDRHNDNSSSNFVRGTSIRAYCSHFRDDNDDNDGNRPTTNKKRMGGCVSRPNISESQNANNYFKRNFAGSDAAIRFAAPTIGSDRFQNKYNHQQYDYSVAKIERATSNSTSNPSTATVITGSNATRLFNDASKLKSTGCRDSVAAISSIHSNNYSKNRHGGRSGDVESNRCSRKRKQQPVKRSHSSSTSISRRSVSSTRLKSNYPNKESPFPESTVQRHNRKKHHKDIKKKSRSSLHLLHRKHRSSSASSASSTSSGSSASASSSYVSSSSFTSSLSSSRSRSRSHVYSPSSTTKSAANRNE